MIPSLVPSALLGGALALAATAASAHVTLETPTASIGSYYKAVFRVPHGCDGRATVQLRVHIPDGVVDVKPMPKPGWTLAISKGKYPQPIAVMHGPAVSEGVKEVDWSGGSLPDDEYDEFVVFAYLSNALKPDARLYWPVVQGCTTGADRWVQIPGSTQSSNLEYPAPSLQLAAAVEHGVDTVKVGDLVIERPWARATPGGVTVGAGYLTITNHGKQPDRLMSGTSPIAPELQVHQMIMKNGMSSMRAVTGGLEIPPGKSVTLSPGGYHLMMMGLKKPLVKGEQIPATLTFQRAGKVKVTFDVQGIGAMAPEMKMMPGMKM